MNTPWALIDGYLDGVLSETELRELEQWLAQGPGNRRCLAMAAQDHTILHSHFRVERGVAAERVRRPIPVQPRSWWIRGWRLVAAGMAACLVVAGMLWMPMQARVLPPAVVDVVGSLWVERDGSARLIERGEQLQPGDVVRTTGGSHAILADGRATSSLELRENSTVEIPRGRSGRRYELRSGSVSIAVSSRWPAGSIEVWTPHAWVEADHSTLEVFTSARSTRLRVDSGEARLDGTQRVRPVETPTIPGNEDSNPPSAKAASRSLQSPPEGKTGGILRETWRNLPGGTVEALRASSQFPAAPSERDYPATFESPEGGAQHDFYGTRWRGFLYPPVSGAYTFWIAADDAAELRLSDDEQPEHGRPIASVSSYTMPREWTKSADQESVAVPLEAGRRYYVEVLHKENAGGDHVAVAWQLPGAAPVVISGKYLSPWLP